MGEAFFSECRGSKPKRVNGRRKKQDTLTHVFFDADSASAPPRLATVRSQARRRCGASRSCREPSFSSVSRQPCKPRRKSLSRLTVFCFCGLTVTGGPPNSTCDTERGHNGALLYIISFSRNFRRRFAGSMLIGAMVMMAMMALMKVMMVVMKATMVAMNVATMTW